MALETMMGVKEINGQNVYDVTLDYTLRDDAFIQVDHNVNLIAFYIQNGPVKENGKNGCQVEDIVAVAKHIVEQLNDKFPCEENLQMIYHLSEAVHWSKERTIKRINRDVEGQSKE